MKSWRKEKPKQRYFECQPTMASGHVARGCGVSWWDDEKPSWCPNPRCVSVKPERPKNEQEATRG